MGFHIVLEKVVVVVALVRKVLDHYPPWSKEMDRLEVKVGDQTTNRDQVLDYIRGTKNKVPSINLGSFVLLS